jgi:hypothetical protein
MSSPLNEVVLSAEARKALHALPDGAPRRRLLLALTTLKKDARPEDSRALLGEGPEAREWLVSGFQIAYEIDTKPPRISVGIIRRIAAP